MKQPLRLPCPCGSRRDPLPVVDPTQRKGRFHPSALPECRLTTRSARRDRINIAWNRAVTEAREVHRGEK
jgi:hypothetical protein